MAMPRPLPAGSSLMNSNSILDAPNPFTVPSDEQIFVLRDEEKRRRLEERERAQGRRIYEKTTWSNRIGSARAKTRVLAPEDADPDLDPDTTVHSLRSSLRHAAATP
eukprot:RCo038002